MKKALAQGYILEETENTVVIATGFLRPRQLQVIVRHFRVAS